MSRYKSDSGFTLVELLIVMGTIFLLVQISLKNYSVYKERLYLAHADDVMRQLKTAVESAKIEMGVAQNSNDWDAWPFISWSQGNAPWGFNFDDLLPGYSHDEHMYVYVDYNGICEAGFWGEWCQVTYISVRHCSTDITKAFWSDRNGTTGTWEWDNFGWPCP